MAAELPRPGVEVIQVFQTVSPTVITPTLVPCVVGVCRQVVDVLVTSATGARTLNSQALVPLPALAVAKAATGGPPAYAGLAGLALVLSLNNGPALTITFAGTPLSPAQVVAQILAAFSAAGVTAFTAETVGTTQWRIRSFAADEFQSIKVIGTGVGASSPVVLAAFGFGSDKVYAGASAFDQHLTDIMTASFPDPNRNLSQLVIDPATVRAFLFLGGTGGALLELLRTEAFLRNGIGTAASVTGSVDLTTLVYPAGLDTLTLIVKINGGAPLTVTFATPASAAVAISQINAVIGAVALATLTSGTNFLKITTLALGATASVEIVGGTAVAALGLVVAPAVFGVSGVQALDSGSGSALTPLLNFPGADFTTAPGAAAITGSVPVPGGGVADGLTLTLDDGTQPQTLTFFGATTPALVISQINALFGAPVGGRTLATLFGGALRLTNTILGAQSKMQVVGGTAMATLGLVVAPAVYGAPFAPLPGDTVWVDGTFYATITQVAPGGNVSQLKIDRQVPISANVGIAWYIVAKNLNESSGTTGVTRPHPNLIVDASGNVRIVNDALRDTRGNPIYPSRAQVYIAYHALRLDVTSKAKNPGLLRFSDTTQLSSQLSPIDTNNPLALGLYFALLNAPGTQVTGLGVDATSAGSPLGTAEAFSRAATFLEGYEVYALAPLTHDSTVFQIFTTHVSVMSAPENKGERVVLINPTVPTHKLDALVASGVDGNTTPTPNTFDTGVVNLGALLLANGLSGTGPYATSAGIYLDVGDGKKYNVINVVGSVVTVKTSGFLPGENDDSYYATTTLPSPLIAEPFAVRIRGAALVLLDNTPDKDGIAVTVQQTAQGYANRRVWSIFPDACAATLQGLEQIIDGFYLNAAIAGMIAQQPPQQSFTNFPMTGFTRVIGSNDRFGERQLNVMAAGGNWIVVQDAPGVPLTSRMALTTDLTSVETRTDSITKVVDFCAKFLRQGLKNFIGRFNITQGFLDSLGHVIQGLLGFLAESGVLIGSNLNNIVQDTTAPDTVLIDITLDVPFPCNYIRLTLVI